MKIFLKYLIVLLVINTVEIASLTLQSEKLCRILNEASLKQKNDECFGHLKFKCGYDYCSFDQETCEIFQKIYSVSRSFMRIDIFERKITAYKKFINTIKSCQIREQDIVNLKYNVCLRDKTCMAQEEIKWNNMSQFLTKKVFCPCIKEHKFDCDKEMCAENRYDCMAYKQMKKINNQKQYNSCQNGNRKFNLKY